MEVIYIRIINSLLNFLITICLIILLYILFPSFNTLFNDLSEKISTNAIIMNSNISGIGEIVEDSNIIKTYGDRGTEYEFDTIYYPYYGMIDFKYRDLYKQIYANAVKRISDFTPIVDVSKEDISFIIEAVLYDHPELFFLDNSFSYKYNHTGNCLQINLKFIDDLEEDKFFLEANKIINVAKNFNSDIEKEKYVHNVFINNLTYTEDSLYNQSAYSAIVNKKSVCAGYSKAFQYILMELGIPCYYVTGDSSGDHAWNIVKIGNYFYNVDLTWDDTGVDIYDYFNKSDSDFSVTHVRSIASSNLPKCIGSSYTMTKYGILN